jgi:cyclophilin family peptidyl-prolyl cis-trans isomerase
MKRNVLNALLSISTVCLLFACGGGGGTGANSSDTTTIPATNPPSVTAVAAGNVIYKKEATITVTGQNLDSGITATAVGCSNLTEQPGGTSASRTYSCVPFFGTSINFTVSATASRALLKQISVPVPPPQVTLATSMGIIVVELRPDRAKNTVDNFLQYVNDGFYSNTVFHRIVSGFVVQGGGYAVGQTTLKSTSPPIVFEAPSATGLSNNQGTIAMARATGLNSATSQFFINTVNNPDLDTSSGGYAVFGSVIQGMDVVKAIEKVAVDSNSWPTTAVTMNSTSQTSPITVTTLAAPSGVVATSGKNQVTLTWNTDSGAASYTVYASNTSGVTPTNGTKQTNLFPPVTLNSLTSNATYYYVITAVNKAGESAPSAQVSATTLP